LAQTLKFKRKYLRTEQLQPLDVILTRPRRSVSSKLIATSSWGKYSHAALVLSRNLRFESVAKGVKPTSVIYIKCEVSDNDFVFIEETTEYKYFDVFRHPHLSKMSPRDLKGLQKKLIALLPEVIYREYPDAKAFQRFPIARPFKIILNAYSKIQKKAIPGPFCSELVCRLYDRLNLPLFDTRIHHRQVSPTRLSRSRLINISNQLIYEPRVEALGDELLLEEINTSSILIRSTIETAFLRFAAELSRSLRESNIFVGSDKKEMIELAETLRDLTVNPQAINRGVNNDWIFWSILIAIKRCWKRCALCKLPSGCKIFHAVTMKRLHKMIKEQENARGKSEAG